MPTGHLPVNQRGREPTAHRALSGVCRAWLPSSSNPLAGVPGFEDPVAAQVATAGPCAATPPRSLRQLETLTCLLHEAAGPIRTELQLSDEDEDRILRGECVFRCLRQSGRFERSALRCWNGDPSVPWVCLQRGPRMTEVLRQFSSS